MRETTFIEQKKKNWAKFEKMHRLKESDPDEMTKLFVEITDDLSYSRTFYQKRSVRVYLNFIAQMVFLKINKGKKVKASRFIKFWTYSLPMEFARSWKAMVLSLVIFSGAMVVGIVSTYKDVGFAREIIDRGYMDNLDRNIAAGDPMAVYHQGSTSLSSTYGITLNNTMVAARTYTSGILTGLPTASILINNGVSIGTFHQYLMHKGVLGEALFVIWIHGVLEISAIVIAGGAGFVLGLGFLFPGSFTRMQAFRISAKRSFKIAMSTLFILIVSGFIEGSITRYTQMPFFFKAVIIGASLLFVIGYFVLYPMFLYRKHIIKGGFKFEDKIPHIDEPKVELYKVRDVGEMYNDTLALVRGVFSSYLKGFFALCFPIAIICSSIYFGWTYEGDQELFWKNNLQSVFLHPSRTALSLITLVGSVLTLFLAGFYALKIYRDELEFSLLNFYKFSLANVFKLWPVLLFVVGSFYWQSVYVLFISIAFCPLIFQFSYAGFVDDTAYGKQLLSNNKIIWKTFFSSIGFWLLLLVMPFILIVFSNIVFGKNGIAIIDTVVQYLQDNISPLVDNPAPFFNALNFILYLIFIAVIFLLLLLGMVIQLHTVKERIEARQLYERLKNFGTKNKLFEQADEGEY